MPKKARRLLLECEIELCQSDHLHKDSYKWTPLAYAKLSYPFPPTIFLHLRSRRFRFTDTVTKELTTSVTFCDTCIEMWHFILYIMWNMKIFKKSLVSLIPNRADSNFLIQLNSKTFENLNPTLDQTLQDICHGRWSTSDNFGISRS